MLVIEVFGEFAIRVTFVVKPKPEAEEEEDYIMAALFLVRTNHSQAECLPSTASVAYSCRHRSDQRWQLKQRPQTNRQRSLVYH